MQSISDEYCDVCRYLNVGIDHIRCGLLVECFTSLSHETENSTFIGVCGVLSARVYTM